jgi:hypothetical protein
MLALVFALNNDNWEIGVANRGPPDDAGPAIETELATARRNCKGHNFSQGNTTRGEGRNGKEDDFKA